MNISDNKNISEYCHMFWLKIKFFRNIIKFFGDNFEFINSDEKNIEIWNFIETEIEDLFNCLLSGKVIIELIIHNQHNSIDKKNELWNNYELFIDNLIDLHLAKEYFIIQDQDCFINDLINSLSFFEDELKNIFLDEK